MKLRTRLFLWIGSIFLLAFGVSLFLEIYLTKKNLVQAENQVRQQILNMHEVRRQQLQEFLRVLLAEDHAQVDSLLLRISRDPQLAATLFINPPNPDLVAPANCAYLFKNDRWIDFLQSTKQGALTSLLIPINFPMKRGAVIPITNDLAWVVEEGKGSVWMGIKLPIKTSQDVSYSVLIDEMIARDSQMMVLFDPHALNETPAQEGLTPRGEGIELATLLKLRQEAAEYVDHLKKTNQAIQDDIKKRVEEPLFSENSMDMAIQCLKEEGDVFSSEIVQLLQRDDQAIAVFVLASLFPSNAFGPTLFSPQAPKGVIELFKNGKEGNLVLTDEVFFQNKAFDDKGYFAAHPGGASCETIGGSMAIISSQDKQRLFAGNTISLQQGLGFLTIAIDLNDLIKELVLSIHMAAFLVHEKKVTNALDAKGQPIPAADGVPFSPELLDKKYGFVTWKGEKYVFQNITPYPTLDLHIFTLEPAAHAFALVDSVDKGSRMVIEKVSFNMRLVAALAFVCVILLLHNVARRVTKPIAHLARVTQDVAAGKLEGIEMPKLKDKKDEVAILCQSFEEMIIGLQEKEKVKGVLNKVVSTEIAEEILKGQVHLGGEERLVTVFFADIRNFTGMTANMEPKNVIEMLNACMTKVSHIIDEHGGVIDKYVGDEVMALFGAPLEKEDSALKAIESALEIVETLKKWNEERKTKGLKPVEMGIGIHTGKVLAGNMGAENRLNYTVIGSDVNLAARLCSAAKPLEILITKQTLMQPHVQEKIAAEELPPLSLKGFEESFVLYRVKGLQR